MYRFHFGHEYISLAGNLIRGTEREFAFDDGLLFGISTGGFHMIKISYAFH